MNCRRPIVFAALAAAAAISWSGRADAARPPHVLAALHGAPAHSWMSPDAKSAGQLLYVADGSEATVDIFKVSRGSYTLVGQITGLDDPEGMTTDDAGNLYVVDDYVPQEGPVGGELDVFPKGSSIPARVINPAPWVPIDVAVDGPGTIYIANIAPIDNFSPGAVTVYSPASDKPIRVLRNHSLQQIDGITFNHRTSDLYVTYLANLNGGGRIARFRKGRGSPEDLGVSFGPPWGIVQDASGNLLASDGNGPIDIYASRGGPLLGTIPVPGDPLFSAFNLDRSLLYVSNFNNFDVEVFAYPSGAMVGSIRDPNWSSGNWPTGVAYWPRPH